MSILWYNVFATNDGKLKLGGQPYDNQTRAYAGSFDDTALNQGIQSISAYGAALNTSEAQYQTTGILTRPVVTMHTTGDPIIPYWHAPLYVGKTILADNIALQRHRKIERYGHCTFTEIEVLNAFGAVQCAREVAGLQRDTRHLCLQRCLRRSRHYRF